MPDRYYKRNVQLIISENINDVPESFRKTTVDGIIIPSNLTDDNLKINFKLCSSQASTTPSDNIIKIWNLKGETQAFLKKTKLYVQVLAGYDSEASNIYTGQISKVEIKKKGVDTITMLYVGNLNFDITQANFSKSYSGLVDVSRIVNDALNTFGLTTQYTNLIPASSQKLNYSFDGSTKDCLTSLLTPLGIHWYVENSNVKLSKEGEANQQQATVISSSTGLINIPYKTDKGVNIDILLNTNLSVSDYVDVQLNTTTDTTTGRQTDILKEELNGLYKIFSIKYIGDTIEGNYITRLECARLDSNDE